MTGNATSFAIYQGLADRALLQIKLGNALKMEREMRALSEKYDGKDEANLEDEINKVSERAQAVADYKSRVEYATKRIGTVRDNLVLMQAAVDGITPDSFDSLFNDNNQIAGRNIKDPTSLISNPTDGYGNWNEKTDQVDGGFRGAVVSVKHHYIGADYAITLNDGSIFRPDASSDSMIDGAGNALEFSKLSVTSLDTSTGAITFHYDDGAAGVDYTGTLARGGNGVLNAWLYNNFADQDGIDRATADINDSYTYLAKAERDMLNNEAGLAASYSGLKSKADTLNAEYARVAEENITAKMAESSAIKARFDFLNNSLALTQGNSTFLIQSLFLTSPTFEKPSMTSIMMQAHGY